MENTAFINELNIWCMCLAEASGTALSSQRTDWAGAWGEGQGESRAQAHCSECGGTLKSRRELLCSDCSLLFVISTESSHFGISGIKHVFMEVQKCVASFFLFCFLKGTACWAKQDKAVCVYKLRAEERIIGWCLWTYSVYSFSFLIEKLILKPVLFIKAIPQCHLGLE